jgi:hypothetical protein
MLTARQGLASIYGPHPESHSFVALLGRKAGQNQVRKLREKGLMNGDPRAIEFPLDCPAYVCEGGDGLSRSTWLRVFGHGWEVNLPLIGPNKYNHVAVDGQVCGRLLRVQKIE